MIEKHTVAYIAENLINLPGTKLDQNCNNWDTGYNPYQYSCIVGNQAHSKYHRRKQHHTAKCVHGQYHYPGAIALVVQVASQHEHKQSAREKPVTVEIRIYDLRIC